ncbi:hypothetical protein [Massilia haematophila]|uniref:Lipoprotein n=1 Tax=Massilia haematophila TaxID=457923 RepID=A0ABV7PEA5_9BURK
MRVGLAWQLGGYALCGAVMVVGLAGCGKGNAAGGADSTAPARKPGAGKGSYVLVTQLRPESPEKFFPMERRAYALCAGLAQGKNLPVKPFPPMPSDFAWERSTYASDGERSVNRKLVHSLDLRKMKPESGCEVSLDSQLTVALTSEGQERMANQDEDGNMLLSDPEPASEEAVRPSLLASFTQPRRINGVPLKCDAANACIVDPTVALVANGVRPVQASYRTDDPKTYGSALVQEPVSLSVGKPVSQELFSLEAK